MQTCVLRIIIVSEKDKINLRGYIPLKKYGNLWNFFYIVIIEIRAKS